MSVKSKVKIQFDTITDEISMCVGLYEMCGSRNYQCLLVMLRTMALGLPRMLSPDFFIQK